MKPVHVFSTISILLIASLNLGCDDKVTVSGSVTKKVGQPSPTPVVTEYKIEIKYEIKVPLRPETPIPNYEIIIQDYPLSRILLKASQIIHRPPDGSEGPVILPLDLPTSNNYYLTAQISNHIFESPVNIAKLSSLPDGTYLIEAPGLIENIAFASRAFPEQEFNFKLSTTSNSSFLQLMPMAMSQLGLPSPTELQMTIPSNQTFLFKSIKTGPIHRDDPALNDQYNIDIKNEIIQAI